MLRSLHWLRGFLPHGVRVAVFTLAILGGITLLRDRQVARADVEKNNPPQHFLSGDERAEIVLRDILVVLKRMDQRLERLEKAAVGNDAPTDATNIRRGRK